MRADPITAIRASGRGLAGTVLLATLAACSGDGGTGPSSCFLSASAEAATSGAATITIDPSRRFQTIDGFGTSQTVFDDPHVTETFDPATQRAAAIPPAADQAKILDALYRQLGLTRVRIHPDGIEPVNDNADPNVADLSKFSFDWKD